MKYLLHVVTLVAPFALLGCGGTLTMSNSDGSVADSGLAAGDSRVPPAGDGGPSTTRDARPSPVDSGPSGCVGEGCTCVRATEMWHEDFETGDYSRWTGRSYQNSWGDGCQSTALSDLHPRSGGSAERSEIVCASTSPDGVHRGYGGLQFSGTTVLPEYTNTGVGLDAPNGIVTSFWVWLETGYAFGDGRWMSLFTINPTCDYTERVITVGLDNPDGIMRAAHWWPEGRSEIAPDATALPRGQWVRVTVYVNFYSGVLHVWQDGRTVEHVTGIARSTRTMCQWHWGLYASADNTDVVLFEDDKKVWRLDQEWSDWDREPWLGESQAVCE